MSCKYCGNHVVYAKGYCRNCYTRYLRSGSPEYGYGRGKGIKNPTEKQKEILSEYEQTKDAMKTAEKFSCSRQYIYSVIKQYKPFTNGDRIRSMTDEEMATWLGDMLGVYPFGTEQWDRQAWLKWLKKEVCDEDEPTE